MPELTLEQSHAAHLVPPAPMKHWALALLLQLAILSLGFGLEGAAFAAVSLLHTPVVNLLLWTSLITLAGLASSAAARPFHQCLTQILLTTAVCWFPASLLIFGNARFAGTTDLLWQGWLIGTGLVLMGSILSLAASAIAWLGTTRSGK